MEAADSSRTRAPGGGGQLRCGAEDAERQPVLERVFAALRNELPDSLQPGCALHAPWIRTPPADPTAPPPDVLARTPAARQSYSTAVITNIQQ